MSQKAKNSMVKDLDPKDRAKDVKGGILCCVIAVAGLAASAVDETAKTARKTLNPR